MIKRVVFVSLLLSVVSSSNANWYQVEVIIFAYTAPESDGELWQDNPEVSVYDDAIELVTEEILAMRAREKITPGLEEWVIDQVNTEPPAKPLIDQAKVISTEDIPAGPVEDDIDEGPIPFLRLSEDSYRLEGVYRVLKLSRDYRPLQHISWQQPALSHEDAKSLHLSLFKENKDILQELPPELAEIQIMGEMEEPGEPVFESFIRVRSSLFLHVDIDIVFFPELLKKEEELLSEIVAAKPGEDVLRVDQANYVRLKESRKIKLNEMHYFDHPMFGVIVQVSRLEFEEKPTEPFNSGINKR